MNLKQARQILSIILLCLGFGTQAFADELPPGLEQAIVNPAIPAIVDATILGFNKDGHGYIKVNVVYKPASTKGEFVPPKSIRGYGYAGSDKIAPLRVVIGGNKGRYLLFLNGDLLHSTYNNRFTIREGKNGELEVGVGFNGGGGPWKPLKEIIQKIPPHKPATKIP